MAKEFTNLIDFLTLQFTGLGSILKKPGEEEEEEDSKDITLGKNFAINKNEKVYIVDKDREEGDESAYVLTVQGTGKISIAIYAGEQKKENIIL